VPDPHKTPARKRPFGRYKLRCRDNIKTNLTEIIIEIVGRIYLTVDREKGLCVDNIVINFGIPQKLGNIVYRITCNSEFISWSSNLRTE
jgi:hypothetical protein